MIIRPAAVSTSAAGFLAFGYQRHVSMSLAAGLLAFWWFVLAFSEFRSGREQSLLMPTTVIWEAWFPHFGTTQHHFGTLGGTLGEPWSSGKDTSGYGIGFKVISSRFRDRSLRVLRPLMIKTLVCCRARFQVVDFWIEVWTPGDLNTRFSYESIAEK